MEVNLEKRGDFSATFSATFQPRLAAFQLSRIAFMVPFFDRFLISELLTQLFCKRKEAEVAENP